MRRNDPCPCGSGKRYKDCHGAPAGSQAPAAGQASGAQVLLQRAMEAYRG
ncbi:MAG TPA: SEC-C metal-binding domain-containing protein, partial [Casimicrobiaceae bacterium]|nr:SEC-C metal-binding domain-containing protein [Casimicrobiaceae bacterium]